MELRITVDIEDLTEGLPAPLRKILANAAGVPFNIGFGNKIGDVTAVDLDGETPYIAVHVPHEVLTEAGVTVATLFVVADNSGEINDTTEKVDGWLAEIVLDTTDAVLNAFDAED